MKNWIIKNMCFLSAMFILTCIGVFVLTALTLEKGARPTSTQNFLMFTCLGGLIMEMLLGLCSRWLPRWYACDGMGWHIRPNDSELRGITSFGTCPRCKKEVMQDGQGNWC